MLTRSWAGAARRLWWVLAAALAAAALWGGGTALAAGETGRLVVTGSADVKAEPDVAFFQVGVETRAETLQKAREANAAAMKRLQERLIEGGADPTSLQTTGFTVQPEWHYDRDTGARTLVGFRVSHWLHVTVTDLDRLGSLLDAAIAAGANQISGPTFGIRDPEALEQQALREAVRRARAKAQVLAEASGVLLKGIVEIRESVSTPYVPAVRAAFAADAAESVTTPIAPGEVTVSAHVTITYEI